MWRVMAASAAYGRPDLLQAGAALARGHVVARNRGQEAVAQHALEIGALQLGLDGPAHHARAFAENRDRLLRPSCCRARAAFPWPCGSCSTAPEAGSYRSGCPSARADRATSRASARSMLSPPSRMCSPTATRSSVSSPRLLGDGDQREVGGAAADIHHQNQIAHVHALAPVGMALDPGVEGGLRLFEQRQIAGSRPARRPSASSSRATASNEAGTVTSTCCSVKGASGMLAVPGLAQVVQIAAAGLHGRELGHAFGRAEGQHGRGAVHARRARATTWPRRPGGRRSRRRASAPGGPPRASGCGSQGSAGRAGRKIGRAGNIEERRQQAFVAHLRRVHQLGNAPAARRWPGRRDRHPACIST